MSGMVKRGYLMHLVFAILCALVVFTGSTVFGVIIGAAVYVAYLVLMYAEGCSRGEHACSVRDIITKLEKDGKTADNKLIKEKWNVSAAVKAALAICLPFVILAIVNLILSDTSTSAETKVGVACRILFMPAAFITRWCVEAVKFNTEAVQNVAATVVSAFDFGSVDIASVINGVSDVGTYAYAYDLSPLTIMRICYIPAMIAPAAAMVIGYMRGPKLREKTLQDMMKGTSKKRRKLKVFGKQRQIKQAKPEV